MTSVSAPNRSPTRPQDGYSDEGTESRGSESPSGDGASVNNISVHSSIDAEALPVAEATVDRQLSLVMMHAIYSAISPLPGPVLQPSSQPLPFSPPRQQSQPSQMMTLALQQRLPTAIVPQTAIVPHQRTPLTADGALEVISTRDQIYECVRRALSPRTQPKDYDVIVHGFG